MIDINQKIQEIETEFYLCVNKVMDNNEIEELKVKFLGRKGKIRELFDLLKNVNSEERKNIGILLNNIKEKITDSISIKEKEFESISTNTSNVEKLDYTLPGRYIKIGKKHPLSIIIDDLYNIFRSLNFNIIEGCEIEDEYHNFEALNMPKWHPARDLQDSFYINDNLLLRTHTSPVQIRAMETLKPPFRIVTVGGRCYRKDAIDSSHYPVFHQIEGLVVDKNLSLCDLSWILKEMMRGVFEKEVNIKFLPSYFPFVEPGAETLISCPFCKMQGCSTCQNSGWIELGGSGMVHPQVLRNSGINPSEYKGFAFGWGVERLAMIKFGINDIRLFFENNIDFLEQF